MIHSKALIYLTSLSLLIINLSNAQEACQEEGFVDECGCDQARLELYDFKKVGYENSYIKEPQEQFSTQPSWAGKREDSFYDALTR